MGELPPAVRGSVWVLKNAISKGKAVLEAQPVTGPDWTYGCGETLGAQFSQCCTARHRKG
jgi:hypothetical protein